MENQEKRYLETEVTKEAVRELNLDRSKIKTVRRGSVYKTYYYEEVDKDLYLEIKRPEWRTEKRRQRMYDAMEKDGVQEISLEKNFELFNKEIDSSDVDVEEEAMKILEYEALNDALRKLSKEEREIISLLFFKNFTERKAAEIVGISQASINIKKKKILEKLKNELRV